jgi:hypothetical protein
MPVPSVAQLIPILQTAIGPMILISGIGLLILSMTNRLGRVIDRARILASQVPGSAERGDGNVGAQLRILWWRARLVRLAITLAAMSALTAAFLIIVLFFTAIFQAETAVVIAGLFVVCMSCLAGSLGVFIHDINQSLAALKLELKAESHE